MAGKINNLISEFRKNRLAHLSDASPKEFWNVVWGKSNSRPIDDNVYLRNPDIVNNYSAGIATDNGYIKSDVLNFRRIDGTPVDGSAVATGRFLFCLYREKYLHISFWRAFSLYLTSTADLNSLVLLPGGLLWMPY